jgi:hypothetical protein
MPVFRPVIKHGLSSQISFVLIIVEEKVVGKALPQQQEKGQLQDYQ